MIAQELRVMHVVARMNGGGVASQIVDLMTGLEGFDQRLVTGSCEAEEEDLLETRGEQLNIIRISALGRSIRPIKDFSTLVRLMVEIRRFKPDVVHTHTFKAGLLGRIAARLTRPSAFVVHTYHGHLLTGYFGRAGTYVYAAIERVLSRHTDVLVSVGDSVRRDLLARGIGSPEQMMVIRCGTEIGPLPERDPSRRQLGLPVEGLVISWVGRLVPVKRIDRFVETILLLESRGVTATYLVAGDGSCMKWLRQEVARSHLPVRILGWQDDVRPVFAATDILVATSDNEGFPLVLLEARQVGLPFVSTDVGSVSEIVSGGNAALLCEPSSDALAESVLTLLGMLYAPDEGQGANYGFHLGSGDLDEFLNAHANLYSRACGSKDE